MDIRLIRRPHPNLVVRGSGITPTDPYLEWCWLPVVGLTIALVRHVADLTAESGEARLPLPDLTRLLGLGAADVPSRNNKLVRTLTRAEQFGRAFTSLGVPGEQVTFGIHDHVALVLARLLDRLPEVARQLHVAAVEAPNEAPGGRPPARPALGRAGRLADPERPETVATTSATRSVPAGPRRARHAVPPIVRLDASVAATTPPPELSLSRAPARRAEALCEAAGSGIHASHGKQPWPDLPYGLERRRRSDRGRYARCAQSLDPACGSNATSVAWYDRS